MVDPERPPSSTVASLLPAALLLLAPFEPRAPALTLGPMSLTVVEAAAAAGTIALLVSGRTRLGSALRAAPVRWAWALAAAHVLSAVVAHDSPALALKFSLRMAAMALAATAFAAGREKALLRGLRALVLAGLAVSALAVGEGAGFRVLDPLLGLFRETPFNVGGTRRASAGSEYPNLAAAILMMSLVAAGGLAAAKGGWALAALPLTGGLLFTYSRAGLAGAAAGLLVAAVVLRRTGGAAAPLAAMGVLAAGTAAFAAVEKAFTLRLSSEGVASWYGASYEPARSSFALRPGEATTIEVRVTNRGRLSWTRDGLFHLSYHWYDLDRRQLSDGARTVLPRDVGPQESVLLTAKVNAPAREGRYLLLWDMVQEHASWFSGQGVPPGMGRVTVGRVEGAAPGAEAALPAHPEVAWRPGRRELWPLALRMWRERPWTGVGSDNFRRLHGRWAGRPLSDDRVYANNAFLETAATTGLLGIVAMVGLLVSVARSARRAVAASADPLLPATLLALVVAWALHGLADYTLAFTGHYLIFAFIVGATAAVGEREARS